MSKLNNLIGKKFGRLTVISRAKDYVSSKGRKYVQWLCQCSCGNKKIINSSNLTMGYTTSCGCIHKERTSASNLHDLIGQRFGRLIVIKRAEDYLLPCGQKQIRWLCLCDCSNIVVVHASCLVKGITKSCGCLSKELTSVRGREKYIDLTGERFTRWLVLGRGEYQVSPRGRKHILWKCRCDCGTEREVLGSSLRGGHSLSCGCLAVEARSGENSNFYKGGITSLSQQIRNSVQYKQWRTKVFEKGNYTCQYSGEQGGRLQAHHKKPFHQILDEYSISTLEQALACDELWDVENGVTLSERWHSGIETDNELAFHRLYGTRSFTELEFEEWVIN